ncbi:hypothetical protein ACJIZ3_003290 [Penstemon smallii]|uniref:Enoyl reductase (ER) domain-containing protein n=1 Tax=Penstemon smallii TaxID=265156 RepID=A0ABD3UC79_9LAMI
MRLVHYVKPGGPEVLKILEVSNPIIKDDEVLIEVAAVGVNVEDIWRRMRDLVFTNPYLGHECSGTVIETGANVLHFKKGDKVCALLRGGGGYAEFVAARAMHVKHIPLGVSMTEAATLPVAVCLTIYCLTVLRQATPGKKIMIHAAASTRGFGLIALQYAKYCGCDVFASERGEKLQTCKSLGATVCINYETEDFCNRVMAETSGKGVDLILDINGPCYLAKNVNCLARRGTLITLGFESGCRDYIDRSVFETIEKKELKHIGADILTLPRKEISELFSQAEELIWPLFKDGRIKATVGAIFNFSAAAEAHKVMNRNRVAGKILLAP